MTKYRIIEVDDVEEYRNQLIRFWDIHLLSNPTDLRFDWLYKHNPGGPTATLLAFADDQKEFIACGSFYPSTFFCNGEPVRVAIPIDFFVEKSYRVFGPAVNIQKMIISAFQKRGFEVAFVAPNKQALGVFKKVGYTHVGQAKGWVRILKFRDWLRRYLPSLIIAKTIAPVVDFLYTLKDWKVYHFDYRNYFSEIVDNCSIDFDDLWNREKSNFDLLTNKTSKYLNWYYSSNTTNEYKYFCLLDKKYRKLRAYIVFFRNNDEIIISDIFPADNRWLKHLLWHFIEGIKHNQTKAIRLNFFGNDAFKKTIKQFGFMEREHERDYCFFFKYEISEKYMSLLRGNRSTFLFMS